MYIQTKQKKQQAVQGFYFKINEAFQTKQDGMPWRNEVAGVFAWNCFTGTFV